MKVFYQKLKMQQYFLVSISRENVRKVYKIITKTIPIPAFDIDLKATLSQTPSAKIKKEENTQSGQLFIKNEFFKDLDIDDIVQTLMESEEPATKVKHKKRGRPPKNKNTLGK